MWLQPCNTRAAGTEAGRGGSNRPDAVEGGGVTPLRMKSETFRDVAPYAGVAALFIVAVLITAPVSAGDTSLFATSVAARLEGRNYFFWDFGHLLWRPLGTLVASATNGLTGSTDSWSAAFRALIALNLIGGLASCLLLLALLRQLGVSALVAMALTVAFVFTHGVLTYTQSGTAYMPGMFFLMAGFYFAIRSTTDEDWRVATVLAGVAGAIAASLWFPYVFVIPAIGIAAACFGVKRGIKATAMVMASSAVVGAIVFIGIALALGITTPREFIVWMRNSSHDITSIGGLPRTILGFGRSLLFVGDDGAVLRRFLHGDTHNPVSLARAAATRIWMIGLIWLVGFAVLWQFVRVRGGPMLFVFATAAVPIFAFAVMWQGGDVSRYFPLYPCLFMLLGVFASRRMGGRGIRSAVALGLVFMALNNAAGLSVVAANRRRDAVAERLANLRGIARNNDMIFASHSLDEVFRFGNTYPLEPLIDGKRLQHRYLVQFGTPETVDWKPDFADRVQRQWNLGNQVWIASRLLRPRPMPEWNWVEGSDPRIQWSDFYTFFSRFEYVDPTDGDGFVRLDPTPWNSLLIEAYTRHRRMLAMAPSSI
jgi:hypothetical protein